MRPKGRPHTHNDGPLEAVRAHLQLWHGLGEYVYDLDPEAAKRVHDHYHEQEDPLVPVVEERGRVVAVRASEAWKWGEQ